MTTRAMGPMAGLEWLKRGLNLGRSNPKAIFGGAALLLVAIFLMAVPVSLLMGGTAAAAGPGSVTAMIAGLLAVVLMLLAMSVLMLGYYRLLDAVENGRPARALDALAGFRELPTSLRMMGFLVSLTVAQNLILVVLIGLFAREFGAWYMQNLQASMAGGAAGPAAMPPEGFGLAFVVMMIVGLFFYAVQAVGLGQIALRGRGVGGALADGVAGAGKNLLPLLVLALAMMAAVVVLAIVFVLLAAVGGLLAKLLGGWVMVVLGVPLYFAFVVGIIVVMFGVMYHLWRDIAGGGPAQAVPPAVGHHVEL